MKAKKAKRRSKREEQKPTAAAAQRAGEARETDLGTHFLTVAIGASAGGFDAFSELVENLPSDSGMAFVLVQHLDPKHHSILRELMAKRTSMPVVEVTDGTPVERDHVYVIPPNMTMTISERVLHLRPREEGSVSHMTVDSFMRSLAADQGPNAIGVILSGVGSDGTLGMAEIQAQGGVTFAQDETTAKYDGMPRSAIAAGCVDFVLPPKGIAQELARIAKHPYVVRRDAAGTELVADDRRNLNAIFQILRRATGVDFTYYRETTIRRRIQRRMVVHKMEQLEDYLKYLQQNPAEARALYQDMLINVTSFFRDPRVFEALKSHVFPAILKGRPGRGAVRIWTPGCASGEETYSVAIALLEFLEGKAPEIPIQMFGTDVSDSAIAKARAAMYPENIQEDVSADRLRRYFTKVDKGYRISKKVRDICVFAEHNVISDPPFSQMDLIGCRNLMIYLELSLQKRLVSLFHYALRPHGFLVLGTSEGLNVATDLFTLEDRSSRIFLKRPAAQRPPAKFSLARPEESGRRGDQRAPLAARQAEALGSYNFAEAQKEFDRRLLAQYAPAAVFLNGEFDVVHTRGDADRYLKLSPGRATLNVLKMTREGLLYDLRNALARAKKEGVTVRKRGVAMKRENDGPAREIDIEVAPVQLNNDKDAYYMVVFRDAPEAARPAARRHKESKAEARRNDAATRRISKLEQELAASKEYLQSVIEEQEATNEELQSANEEILSSNEELQSTNEELETAKEELQSANEELITVNDELRNRNLELALANNDFLNLLGSVNLAIVMLGSDLTIRRFTPPAQKILGLIPADIGRPFANISPTIEEPRLAPILREVMENLKVFEEVVKDKNGTSYLMRVLPYRTSENKIEGAVLTLLETSRPV
jgi:two-component system, chemotaxis family, CheB/CheR fusion protein